MHADRDRFLPHAKRSWTNAVSLPLTSNPTFHWKIVEDVVFDAWTRLYTRVSKNHELGNVFTANPHVYLRSKAFVKYESKRV